MVNQCVKQCVTRHVIGLEKPNFRKINCSCETILERWHTDADDQNLASSSNSSAWNNDDKWSAQVRKSGEMCSKHARRAPYWALAHQTTQNGTFTTSGLLKCGNLVKCRKRARGNLYLTSWSSTVIWTLTPPQNRTVL